MAKDEPIKCPKCSGIQLKPNKGIFGWVVSFIVKILFAKEGLVNGFRNSSKVEITCIAADINGNRKKNKNYPLLFSPEIFNIKISIGRGEPPVRPILYWQNVVLSI